MPLLSVSPEGFDRGAAGGVDRYVRWFHHTEVMRLPEDMSESFRPTAAPLWQRTAEFLRH